MCNPETGIQKVLSDKSKRGQRILGSGTKMVPALSKSFEVEAAAVPTDASMLLGCCESPREPPNTHHTPGDRPESECQGVRLLPSVSQPLPYYSRALASVGRREVQGESSGPGIGIR